MAEGKEPKTRISKEKDPNSKVLDNERGVTSNQKQLGMAEEDTNDFEKCVGIGKTVIDNIKASLLASSASFNHSFNRGKGNATLEDPYAKAYQYLEKNEVLAMLEDLIAQTVFHRPEKPLPFMTKVVENFYTESK